jgi:Zn-dependent protease
MEQLINPIVFLIFPIVLFSLSVHECAHALVAYWGGDDTARLQGRITLNPISHIDPFGTIIVPLLLGITGAPVLGWARPVQVNPMRLRKPIWNVYVTAAGPGSNFLLALIAVLIMKIATLVSDPALWHPVALQFASLFIIINVSLAIFNLMPIPPLDGSKIFFHFVIDGRPRFYPFWAGLERYSFIVLYLFIILEPVQQFLVWATSGVLTPLIKFTGI